MAQPQGLPGVAEQVAAIADAVVGHDPAHGDALAGEPDDGPGEEAGAGIAGLVVQDLDIGGPGMVVDADMDILEADLAVLADAAAGDAVSGLVEAGEPLDVEMDEIARPPPLVAPDRRLRLERRQLAEAEAGQLGRHRGAGEPEAAGDLGRGQPVVPEPQDQLAPALAHPASGVRGREERSTRPETPSARSRARHLRTVADPDAEARGGLHCGPAALDTGDQQGSTVGIGPRILVDVHSGPPTECWLRNPHSRAARPG